MYNTCAIQICAPTCPFSNVNISETVPQPGEIPAKVTPDKAVGYSTKSVNSLR